MPVDERWITADEMAENKKKMKIARRSKLGSFTRKQKHLQALLDEESDGALLEKSYDELSDALKDVEKTHEEYLLLLEEDELDAEDSYLDDPSDTLARMHISVGKAIANAKTRADVADKDAEKKRLYEGSLAAFRAGIESFGNPSTNLTLLSTEKTVSCLDMRAELSKLEVAMSKLMEDKVKLLNMDPAADITAECEMFNSRVVDEVARCKRIILEYVKDDVASRTVAAADTGGGTGSGRSSFSTTKRETVMLPQFSGDEKTAFLKYPVWKQQWDGHITEYEHKYRATMLLNHWTLRHRNK